MNATYESLEEQSEIDLYTEMGSLIRKNPPGWQSICAVLGLAGGVSAPFLGAAFDVTSWFVSSPEVNSYLHVLSIVSCALTFPLLILGALCLDLLATKTAHPSPAAEPAR